MSSLIFHYILSFLVNPTITKNAESVSVPFKYSSICLQKLLFKAEFEANLNLL